MQVFLYDHRIKYFIKATEKNYDQSSMCLAVLLSRKGCLSEYIDNYYVTSFT